MTQAGFAAVLGASNAGKSTLVNRLVGAKVSIVTQKVQTTRFPVRGVAMVGDAQIVLVDTPGVFKPRRRLDRAMVRSAWAGAEDADAVVHLVDVQAELAVEQGSAKAAERRSVDDAVTITEALKAAGRKAVLALNKIDGVKREALLGLSHRLFDAGIYSEAFMISAANGSGVDDLKARLAEMMPQGPWLYPEDQAGDLPARLLAAEITREKLYLRVPRGAALRGERGDDRVRRTPGRLCAHRADDLHRTRDPATDHPGGRRSDAEVDRPARARGS